jgi:hypothetical protein
MKWIAILLLFGIGSCGRQADPVPHQQTSKPDLPSIAATQSMVGAKQAAMHSIPVPKDKAQLDRMLAMGYTVHEDHMHPPGVKECPLDKAGSSVVQ